MKKRILLIFAIIIPVVLITLFSLKDNSHLFIHELWAYDNWGQNINGRNGKAGIDMNLQEAWKYTKGSSDIVIALVDTGVNISLEYLNIYNNGIDSWDFYNNQEKIYNCELFDYHGTYLAAAICSNDNDVPGVAPESSILPIKFMEGTSGNSDDAAASLKYACDKSVQIVNCSWAMSTNNTALYDVIKDNPNILFVCAAGNEGTNLDKYMIYPASYDLDNIIVVTAINNQGKLYDSAGYGSYVTIAAPGQDIFVKFTDKENGYVDGTSVATAYVSGIASLMLSVNSELTPTDIKQIIIETATTTPDLKGLCESNGYINAGEAIKQAIEY